jgi:hypothetical protein
VNNEPRPLKLLQYALSMAITLAVAVYAAIVVHQFFAYINHAVYLAVDDSLANTSYALATHGRYGFPASPVLMGISRNDGLFNFGPWYFFLGAGLIWLFGYSLTLLRSIHLAIVIGAIVAARAWLSDGRPRTPEWALFAVGLLWIFDPGQWPMVRPDIMVSAFALAFVLTSGRAIQTGSSFSWFAAGVCAGCGALTHLIAWALVPAAGIVWAIQAIASWRAGADPAIRARQLRALAAVVAGGVAAAMMFYASFGFRIGDQIQFVQGYRRVTFGALQQNVGTMGYLGLVARHFSAAFGWFPPLVQRGFIAVWALAVILVALASWRRDADSPDTLARLMPPLVAWTCYLASLGFYANFHSGYAMLNQFLALWVAAAAARVLLRRAPMRVRPLGVAALACVVLLATSALARQKVMRPNYRVLHTDTWVGIEQYVHEVLASIPRGSTAWGTLIFGIENPDRLQLLQYVDAVLFAPLIPPSERAALAPEFLVWGYPENRGIPSDVAMRQPTWPQSLDALFPAVRYEPAALIAADPYGVTRVYVRRSRESVPSRAIPMTAAFDSGRHQWVRTAGQPTTGSFTLSSTPLKVETTRVADPHWIDATHTYRADLPPGDYVVRVFLSTGPDPVAARMIVASSAPIVEVTRTELSPAADICAFGSHDTMVQLLLRHSGGVAYVGHFDPTAGAAVERIELAPLEPLAPARLGPATMARAIAPADWTAYRELGVTADASGGGLVVRGNATQYGYQVISRALDLTPGARVMLHIGMDREAGSTCIGVLDKTTQRWLVSADRIRAESQFIANDSGGAYVVVANCNADPAGNPRSGFTIRDASIEVESEAGYSDRYMKAAIAAGAIKP